MGLNTRLKGPHFHSIPYKKVVESDVDLRTLVDAQRFRPDYGRRDDVLVFTQVETELGARLRFGEIDDQRRYVAGGKPICGDVAGGDDSVLDVDAGDTVAVDRVQRCRTNNLSGNYPVHSASGNGAYREIPGKEIPKLEV